MADMTTLELVGFIYPADWAPFTDARGRELPVHLDHADGTLLVAGQPCGREELSDWDRRRHFQRTPDETDGAPTDLDSMLAGTWEPDGREFLAAGQDPLP